MAGDVGILHPLPPPSTAYNGTHCSISATNASLHLGYSRRMTTQKYSTDAAREVVKQALRRDPSVHLFDDEADRMSRAVIRALVAHWPARFSDRDRAKGEDAK